MGKFNTRHLIHLLFIILALLLVACGGEGPVPAATESPSTATLPAPVVEGIEATPTNPTPTTAAEAVATEVPIEATPAPSPTAIPTAVAAANPPLPYTINLPPGFRIGYYADNVPNARSMALGPDGTLFVGTLGVGNLYAIRDTNGDYVADEVIPKKVSGQP